MFLNISRVLIKAKTLLALVQETLARFPSVMNRKMNTNNKVLANASDSKQDIP